MTNEQKFVTANDRIQEFNKFCEKQESCRNCLAERSLKYECFAHWLALEAEEEKPENCPFCDGKCVSAKEWNGKFRVVCHEKVNCWYSSSLYDTRAEAIAAHNRVARAVRAAEKGEAK